ncbi:hypothetical protein [Dechloromonas sp. HYN0024]|uniref:hypothetical protein n=1 Tax=Dechloromonas sp. HYN0024 TaxID=2231055 RepID=UPI0013C33027|nr:hypothetical protein [Dechloromonas sp. HYN0024]
MIQRVGGFSHPLLGFIYIPMYTQRKWLKATLVALIVQCSATQGYAAPDLSYPVAGLTPSQRPVNAPVLATSPVLDNRLALRGVSSPIPDSLQFLKDQGGWFTPFTHPGMTGPYDLRGWHTTPIRAAEKK